MLISNRQTANTLHSYSAVACTDITGFGLLGHLAEMIDTDPGLLEVQLHISALPLLAGAAHCIAHKLLSSLHLENSRSERALINPESFIDHPLYPILFDPQTAGGLLAAVPTDQAQQCLAQLRRQDCPQAAIIGSINSLEGAPANNGGRVRLL
jgi:selenide,water dikinase